MRTGVALSRVTGLVGLLWWLCWLVDPAFAQRSALKGIDYSQLDHTIVLSRLRAGTHDALDNNQYYFSAKVSGLIIDKDESALPMEKRKSIVRGKGVFGEVALPSLSHWDEEAAPVKSLTIKGDELRSLVADMMLEFDVVESQVALRLDIELFERDKQLIFFGDDYRVAEAHYWIIPETLPHRPALKDLNLSMDDVKGLEVGLRVNYQKNAPKEP